MAVSSKNITLPATNATTPRRSRGLFKSICKEVELQPCARRRRSHHAPKSASAMPRNKNAGTPMQVRMLTYGFENFAIAPRANSSRKENIAPMTTTVPMRLIQLRKRERRVALGGGVSGGIQCKILIKIQKNWLPDGTINRPAARTTTKLFLQTTDIGHERLHFIIGQSVKRLHQSFVLRGFQAGLDGLGGGVILEVGLHLGVGEILAAKFLAHLGVALALGAVTLDAKVVPVFLGLGTLGRKGGRQTRHRCQQEYFFHI